MFCAGSAKVNPAFPHFVFHEGDRHAHKTCIQSHSTARLISYLASLSLALTRTAFIVIQRYGETRKDLGKLFNPVLFAFAHPYLELIFVHPTFLYVHH